MMSILLHADGHGPFWQEFISIATDPAHLLFELIFSVLFDVVLVSVIWGVIIKKIIIPKLKRDVHREIDVEHGLKPHD